MKTFKGYISNWKRVYFNTEINPVYADTLGFYISGDVDQHPVFGTTTGWQTFHTSAIVKYNLDTMEVETLNSVYQLVGKEVSASNRQALS